MYNEIIIENKVYKLTSVSLDEIEQFSSDLSKLSKKELVDIIFDFWYKMKQDSEKDEADLKLLYRVNTLRWEVIKMVTKVTPNMIVLNGVEYNLIPKNQNENI
jgi:hypothetical protein